MSKRELGFLLLGIALGLLVGMKIAKGNFGAKKQKFKFKPAGKGTIDIQKIKYPKFTLWTAITVIIVVLVLYFFRPWFHEFIIGFYTHPALIFLIISASSYQRKRMLSLPGW